MNMNFTPENSHNKDKRGLEKYEKAFGQLYSKIEPIVQSTNKGNFNEKIEDFIEEFANANGQDGDAVSLAIIEQYNHSQGALPDKLAARYIDLAFNPEAIIKKMRRENIAFHEAVAALAVEAKKKGLNLEAEAIKKAVKKATEELMEDGERVGEEEVEEDLA